MITIESNGSWKKTRSFLKRAKTVHLEDLAKYGEMGVIALSRATPVDTGKTAASWDYQIVETDRGIAIEWINTNIVKYANVAILLQYGHATGTGGYVQGIDYINPALRPIFEEIASKAWKEVTG